MKATGDDDVPGDLVRLSGNDGLQLVIKLINNIFETGECPK